MTLENEVLDSLDDLDYPEREALAVIPSAVTQLPTFSAIVSWLSRQLQVLAHLDNSVNPINDEKDLPSFQIELNSLLREMNCPFSGSQLSDTNKLSIANYLCGELLAARISVANTCSNGVMAVTMQESETARDLKSILVSLEMGKPPDSITSQVLFNKLKQKLQTRLSNSTVEDSLLLPNGLTLSQKQWKTLLDMNETFRNEFRVRREMLLTRCDCTVKSFKWKSSKDSTKTDSDLEKRIDDSYNPVRSQLTGDPNVSISDALAVRHSDCDALLNGRISRSHVPCLIKTPETKGKANKGAQQQLTQQDLHKYLIGDVPDRGGRPTEQPAPPKENFAQQQSQRDNPQRGRGGRGNSNYRGRDSGGRDGGRDGGGRGSAMSGSYQQRVQGVGWAQNTGADRYASNHGYDNSSRGAYREQPYNNYQTGHQRNDYSQQNSGQYFQPQHHQQYAYPAYQSQPHSNEHQFERRGHNNYSDYYGNTSGQSGQYQPQNSYKDNSYYNESGDRTFRGNRRGYRR